MTISSINTNLAAISAQQNIETATQAVQNETTALSSGNRIVNASTDVAALATGTALQSQVNALTTALTVASQGSSLLQVADGALAQIEAIIQQQQSIATSAQSGSLSDVQRGFLNEQFQQLTQQIDQLADSTNFNGVSLINGAIQGGTSLTTNGATGNADKAPVITVASIATVAAAGDTFTIAVGNGPSITLTLGTTSATAGEVYVGNSLTTEAQNIAAALNDSGNPELADFRFTNNAGSLQAYYVGPQGSITGSGTTSAINIPTIATSSSSTKIGSTGTISYDGSTAATLLSNAFGTSVGNDSGLVGVVSTVAVANDTFTINGVTFTAIASGATGLEFNIGTNVQTQATDIVAALNSSTNAALAGLSFASDGTTGDIFAYYNGTASPTVTDSATGTSAHLSLSSQATNQTLTTLGSDGLSAGSTEAIGTANGNLFVSGGTDVGNNAVNVGQAVDLSGVYGNSSFYGAFGGTGSIGAINAAYDAGTSTGADGVTLSVVVGGITYTATEVNNTTLSGTGPNAITFTGNNSSGTAAGGSFTINLQGSQSDITNQTEADQFAAALNAGLSTVSAYQTRQSTSFNNAFTSTVGSTQTATLQGASLSYNSDDFSTTPVISAISVSAPSAGTTDAKITATVNGQTYSTISGIGDTFKTNSEIVLENTSNPDQQIILTTGSTAATGDATGIAVDLSSASNAAAFQTSLESALGLNSGTGAAISFQVGSTTADSIGVSIGSATSSSLFGGQSLDVNTISDASTAGNVLTNALNTVISLRSTVGALEQRFNFATSAATSAQQNEGAAESDLLDTDVASESTDFATSQVQLQAGIAVLAQANQLQQNLLKLLG